MAAAKGSLTFLYDVLRFPPDWSPTEASKVESFEIVADSVVTEQPPHSSENGTTYPPSQTSRHASPLSQRLASSSISNLLSSDAINPATNIDAGFRTQVQTVDGTAANVDATPAINATQIQAGSPSVYIDTYSRTSQSPTSSTQAYRPASQARHSMDSLHSSIYCNTSSDNSSTLNSGTAFQTPNPLALVSPLSTGSANDSSTTEVLTPNVYINGLPPHFPDESLYLMTEEFGKIVSVRTFTRQVGDRLSGYGFVLYVTISPKSLPCVFPGTNRFIDAK